MLRQKYVHALKVAHSWGVVSFISHYGVKCVHQTPAKLQLTWESFVCNSKSSNVKSLKNAEILLNRANTSLSIMLQGKRSINITYPIGDHRQVNNYERAVRLSGWLQCSVLQLMPNLLVSLIFVVRVHVLLCFVDRRRFRSPPS